MSKMSKLLAVLMLLPFLAACTTMEHREHQQACMYGTGVAGAAVGGSIGNVPGAAAGAAVGALMGALACWDTSEPEPEPEPQAAEPQETLDSDGDGVPDNKDWCAGTAAGVEVDERGCPLDSDGDGVPDDKDRCPNTEANTQVDENGCPIEGTRVFNLEGVHFDFDSAKLRPDAEQQLQQGLQKVRDNKGVRIGIIGHTDSTGPESYNQDLSVRRAQSVADYLVSHGVDRSRLSVRGRGESEPTATNETKAGRAENRRVEFVVSK